MKAGERTVVEIGERRVGVGWWIYLLASTGESKEAVAASVSRHHRGQTASATGEVTWNKNYAYCM